MAVARCPRGRVDGATRDLNEHRCGAVFFARHGVVGRLHTPPAMTPPPTELHPYRTDPTVHADGSPPPRQRPSRWTVGVLAACGGVVALVVLRRPAPRAPRPTAAMLQGSGTLVLSDTLPPSTPLAPLLAADGPESFALLEPAGEQVRVDRGHALVLRFNRPMVGALQVGRDADAGLVQMSPPVAGSLRWSGRASLTFTPDADALRSTVTTQLTLSPALRSLAGEALPDDTARTVAFDATPRLDLGRVQRRIAAEAPIRLAYQGVPDASQVAREVMLFESNGLRRTLAFSARAATQATGPGFVDLVPREALSPGSRLTLVYAPSQGHTWGDSPGYFTLDVIPRPQVDGVACTAVEEGTAPCDFDARPGRVVDIAEALTVRASHALGAASASNVTLVPALPGLRVTVAGRTLTVRGDWEPGQVYELRLTGLVSAEGTALMAAPPLAVRSRGLAPAVGALRDAVAYEYDLVRPLPLAAVHAEGGAVQTVGVPTGEEGVAALDPGRAREGWRATPLARLLPSMRANRWGRGQFAWADAGDMVLVRVGATAESTETPKLVQRTRLGVSALRTRAGEHLAWITTLQDGSPRADAAVELHDARGRVLAQGRTDRDGLVRLAEPANAPDRLALVVRDGADRAVLALHPAHGVGAAQLGLNSIEGNASTSDVLASIVTDRGAYRPGETVRAVVYLRKLQGDALAAARRQRATVILMGPNGVVARAPGRADGYGQLTAEFTLERAAPVGEYSVQVEPRVGVVAATRAVTVAEFRPPRMRVDVQTPRAAVTQGERLGVTVLGTYLFGAPVAQGTVRWSLARAAGPAAPQQWAGFQFGPVDAARATGTVAEGEATLSTRGETSLALTPAVALGAAETHTLEVTVREPGGEETTASRAFTVMPAAWRVGIRTLAPWLAAGSRVEGRVVALDATGAAVTGRRVAVTVTREGWRGWFERHTSDADGTPELIAQRARTREVVHRCEVTTTAEAQACGFVPDRPGSYLVEATSEDDAHRVTVASVRTYVAGPGEQPERDAPGAPLTLTPLRTDWYVGERARVAFECPWPEAEALVTVVRERVLHQERRRVRSGGVTWELPITREMIPNAFVTVTLVRPRTGAPQPDGVDLDAPDLRWGATELGVRTGRSPLRVALSLPTARSLVGAEVPVGVTVTDGEGRPVSTRVSLWAVDEGILRLTSYRAGDPFASMRPRTIAGFRLEDLRRQLASRVPVLADSAASGDGDEGGTDLGLRDSLEAFDPTPLWAPRVETDAQGHATVMFRLPTRATEYRVMALATSAGEQSGMAEQSLVATRPVVLSATLPRTLTAGDHAEPSVRVQNTTDAPLDVRVRVQIGDAAPTEQRVRVAAQSAAPVALVLDAPTPSSGATGSLRVRIEADADGAQDVLDRTVPIAPRARWSRASLFGAVQGSRTLTLQRPHEGAALGGTVTLALASHPFVGLETLLDDPDADALDTADALASAILRRLSAATLVRASSHRARLAANQLQIERALARLGEFQSADGGFSLFGGSDGYSDRALTLHVLLALSQARMASYDVPASTVERAVQYVGNHLDASAFDSLGPAGLDTQALALRVLRDLGRPRGPAFTQLYSRRELLGPFGLAQLALCLDADDPQRAGLVRSALTALGVAPLSTNTDNPGELWFLSPTRTVGAVLEAAARSVEDASVALDLAQRARALDAHDPTAAAFGHGHSYAMMGLAALGRRYTPAAASSVELRVDNTALPVQLDRTGAASVTLPTTVFQPGAHTVTLRSPTPLYFSLDARWASALDATDSLARGRNATVHRVLEDAAGRTLAEGARVRVGDLVRVRLFVYDESGSPGNVVLRAPVGGGFDAVQGTFQTDARAAVSALLGQSADDEELVDARIFHAMRSVSGITRRWVTGGAGWFALGPGRSELQEYTFAVRATVPGRFSLPPTQLQAVYQPQYLARSTATSLVVEP